MWKITFSHKGYIVAVIYNRCCNATNAIDLASLSVCTYWDTVRAELVDD